MPNRINTLFPTPDALLAASEIEVEHALLQVFSEVAGEPMRGGMTTVETIANEVFQPGGYPYSADKRNRIHRAINRAAKTLEGSGLIEEPEGSGLIEEPDPTNGKNGYRVISQKGRTALKGVDFRAAMIRGIFSREMFHPLLPDAAWNSFRSGDYDTAVFEAFKAVETAVLKKGVGKNGIIASDHGVALMRKAFDVNAGPLTDVSATPPSRKDRRLELFTGAMGELRNPKAHSDPTITDPLVAVEEMMVASALLRIVDSIP